MRTAPNCASGRTARWSPPTFGTNKWRPARGWSRTSSRCVEDVDAAFARARDFGARVVEELTTWEYGERSGVIEDLAGHRWELTQTVRDTAPEEWGGVTVAPW
jgi:hypothetical protein